MAVDETTWVTHQEQLKQALQNLSANEFEQLVSVLISHLLDVPIAVAKSGFQYGGDAGTAGRQGRWFRLECKKYRDTSSLSERELLGEIEQARIRDEALEAWFLIATRSVPEQIQQTLVQHGEKNGVPIVVIDWGQDHEVTLLAALCAFAPCVLEKFCSAVAGEATRALQDVSANTIDRLRRELQSWCLGFEGIRARSFEKIDRIWSRRDTSYAELGQNAAGGAQAKKVKRVAVHEALSAWRHRLDEDARPAAIIGNAGVGKTWATLEWLTDSRDDLPIMLLMPSSAATMLTSVASETGMKELLARRLYEMTGVRDPVHWFRRLNYLLERPVEEGPVLTVYFDGLNQEPSVPWRRVLQILRGDAFVKNVRVILSTRNHHFEEKLQHSAKPICVGPFDREPGGELDRMLEFEGLKQADLSDEVIEWASIPRLFSIVVNLRERLGGPGQITVHRILWEYWKDTLGARDERSFSEQEWKDWLKKIAKEHRDGIPGYSLEELVETVGRLDLDTDQVRVRLSDIVDGKFVKRDESGDFRLDPVVVAHALGVALLVHFRNETTLTFETLKEKMLEWIDPVADIDEHAEVLRSAVSILVAQGRTQDVPISGVLVTVWLQGQNIPEDHLKELAGLAPEIPNALLDAIEHSGGGYNAPARLRAVRALREIPRNDYTALSTIVARTTHWMGAVPHDVVSSQVLRVAGVDLYPAKQSPELLKDVVPSLIECFPLTKALPIFETEAVASIVVKRPSKCWEGLKWLCLFNKVDPEEMTKALRELSKEILCRRPESGADPDLHRRVAVRLLRLTGREEDEDTAVPIDANIGRSLTYENDYLPRPGRSFLPMERQHAEAALNEIDLTLVFRVQRTREFWLDPDFEPPNSFVEELRAAAVSIDVEKLGRSRFSSEEDYILRELEPALARCMPEVLTDLIRRRMQSIATCPPESRRWSAAGVTGYLILVGKDEAVAAQALRLGGREVDAKDETFVSNKLLLVEVRDLEAQIQFNTLIQADLQFILRDFSEVLHPLNSDDIDALIDRYRQGPQKKQSDLLTLLLCHPRDLSDNAWSWVASCAKQGNDETHGVAFEILTHADAIRFGRILDASGWSWDSDSCFRINHYGTDALAKATSDLPFTDVAPRLAPWLLLRAARLRGTDPDEVRLATKPFGQWLLDGGIEESYSRFNPEVEDFELVFQYAPDVVEQWLEGCSGLTTKFLNRAHNSAFLPLCEALLKLDPCRGVQLWRVLHDFIPFQYYGADNVKKLWHMVFRVSDSEEVRNLREELAELEYCNTDQSLLDLAIVASYYDKSDWLANRIATDKTSTFPWKRRRGEVLEGYTSANMLPVEGAWPDGEIHTNYADLAMTSARHRWSEACARHWWRTFLKAPNPTEAYAAWVLFLRSADRRAFVWIQQEIETAQNSDGFFRLKMMHCYLNQENMKDALKKREDRIDRDFLYSKVFEGIGPWTK